MTKTTKAQRAAHRVTILARLFRACQDHAEAYERSNSEGIAFYLEEIERCERLLARLA